MLIHTHSVEQTLRSGDALMFLSELQPLDEISKWDRVQWQPLIGNSEHHGLGPWDVCLGQFCHLW